MKLIFNSKEPFMLLYSKKIRVLSFLPLAGVLILGVYKSAQLPLGDFANYYFSAVLFLKGPFGHQLYDPVWFNQWVENQGILGFFGSFSPFPPADAFVLIPLVWLKPETAKLVFLIFNSGLFLGFLFRWFRVFEIPDWVAILTPIAFFKPIQSNLFQGQVYLLLFILMIEGFLAFQKNRIWLCSFLWSTAILLKIFPVILVLLIFGKRSFQPFFIFFVGFISLLGICLFIQGWEIWSYFFSEILPKASAGEVIDRFAVSYQSWNSLLSHLFIFEPLVNPYPFFNSTLAFDLSFLLIKSLILGVCIGVCLLPNDWLLRFSVLILSAILLTPTGSMYALLPSMVLIFLLFSPKSDNPHSLIVRLAVAGMLFLISNYSFHQHENWPLAFRFSRLFLLFLLWIVCLPTSTLNWKTLGLVFLLFIPPSWAVSQKVAVSDSSVPFLVEQQNGLLVSFSVEIGKVSLVYRDQNGLHTQNHKSDIQSIDNRAITIINGQLYYKENEIQNSPDLKKNPVLINGNTVLYLSDKNRGQGFYSLRLLTLPND